MDMLGSIFNKKLYVLAFILVIHFFYNPADSGAVTLTQDNVDMTLASNELVFINFYADWCRFSELLKPIFDDTADTIAKEFPEPGRVVLAKVDCDKETSVASRFHIVKYPTLKLIRNGLPAKKEYRGPRTKEGFLPFIREQMADPIKEFGTITELTKLESNKRIIIGYFDRRDQPEYNTFRRVATNLKDDCQFHVGFGDASRQMHPPGQPVIVFRPDKDRSNDLDETFTGDLKNFDELHIWIQDKCVPLVREITFENAEELTEEGLPFLILFHRPDDNDIIKRYTEVVKTQLLEEKQNINFLTADGKKFAHPLHHLGKSEADLPLLAVDSFRHMYLFPNIKNMEVPGKLKKFLDKLYSGKLHQEYHYGSQDGDEDDDTPTEEEKKQPTTPPESTFKNLAPSKNRYTLLKDEL